MAYVSQGKENSNPQHQQDSVKVTTQTFSDNRESTTATLSLQAMMANSPQQQKLKATAQMVANSPAHQRLNTAAQTFANKPEPLQRAEDEESLQPKLETQPAQLEGATEAPRLNNTGLPDNLKSGIENLSGMSMDHVKVHYNSDKPAQLQAHAYAQGSEIHVAPGQEQHLPHEAWHVVQQAQGRVKPTVQVKGNVPVNNNTSMETEVDVMSARAVSAGVAQGKFIEPSINVSGHSPDATSTSIGVLQGRWPTIGELTTGGLALVGGGLALAAGATAPLIAGGALVGGALGYMMSGSGSSNNAPTVTTPSHSAPEKTEPTKAKAKGSGTKKLKPVNTKETSPRDSILQGIALAASQEIVQKRAVNDINKRARIFNATAAKKGIMLSKAELKKVEKAWNEDTYSSPQTPIMENLGGDSTDDGQEEWKAQATHHYRGPQVIFDPNTKYAKSVRLLKWVNAQDSEGTQNVNGKGSAYAHKMENQARAAARRGDIEKAIEDLQEARKIRASDFGGQFAHDTGHGKAVVFIDNLIADLRKY